MNHIYMFGLFLMLMFLLYIYDIFELVDTILDEPCLKKPGRIPVGIINMALILAVSVAFDAPSFIVCILIVVMLFVEFWIFHKDTVLRVVFVTLACSIHVMAVRAICVSVFSMVTGLSIHMLTNDGLWLTVSTGVAFALLNICILLVIKFIPAKSIRIINQHQDQLAFMTLWLVIANLYFLFNTQIYNRDSLFEFTVHNQLAVSVFIMCAVYIVLFFTMKTGELLNYKEKNDELLQVVENEQQFRDSVTNDALSIYEISLSQDVLIKGFEEAPEALEKYHRKYSDILKTTISTFVYADDAALFLEFASPENLLTEYRSGKVETELEYRRLNPDGTCFWAKAIGNLYEEKTTGDIKAFIYMKDIHDEKLQELDIKNKAELDSLTGLYNKGTTESLIEEFISERNAHLRQGALFIIDVDNFKTVNDRLGHTFGDAVLCELADKLRAIFRSREKNQKPDGCEDIIGRVGGDEYMVFMENTVDMEILTAKAECICRAFRNTYQSKSSAKITISGSIGIALFPENGRSFEDLYKYADVALYLSKGKGKDIYSFYKGEEFVGYESKRGEIDSIDSLPQKSFHDNRIEYTVKILFDAENHINAVQAVLQLLTDSMNFSRGYIFETSKDGTYTRNTYEWCAEGITPEIDNLQNVPIEAVETANNSFLKDKYFILGSLEDLPGIERDVLAPQGIKSMLQFGIFDEGRLVGFIGFDDCIRERGPERAEVDEMTTLCNILASFIVKQHHAERAARDQRMFTSVMDRLDTYVYVINPESHEILFANKKTTAVFGADFENGQCFSLFRGESAPCGDCPLAQQNGIQTVCATEIYNKKIKIWVQATASPIKWGDGEDAALINCVDITKYRAQFELQAVQSVKSR